MAVYEYKVIPAPERGKKARGVKGATDKFAYALESAINGMAVSGWEYVRSETLPCEERRGLAGRRTIYRNLLVFRREKALQPDPAVLTEPIAEPRFAARKRPDSPEEMAAAAAATLRPETERGRLPSLGLAEEASPPPRPDQRIGPARRSED